MALPFDIPALLVFIVLFPISSNSSDMLHQTFPSRTVLFQDFSTDPSGAFTVEMHIGTPPIKYLVYVDIELSANVLDETVYTPPSTNRMGRGIILLRGTHFGSTVCCDNLHIKAIDTDIKFFEFHLINSNSKPNGLNSLALSSIVKRDNYSIIHLLNKKGFISYSSFGFIGKDSEKNYARGQLYYGGVPNEMTSNQRKGKCSVLPRTIFWGCEIRAISLTLKGRQVTYEHTDITYQMIFRTVSNEMIAPKSFLMFVYENVLLRSSSEKACTYENSSQGYTQLMCDCKSVSAISGMVVEFSSDVKFRFKGEELFDQVKDGDSEPGMP